jgi:DNA-directed RNA polymerase subunit RPC12/RpoP
MGDASAMDAVPLLSLKLFVFLCLVPLYAVNFSLSWVIIVSVPLVYFKGALDALYSAEGSPIEPRRVLRLCLSRYYLISSFLYITAVAVLGVGVVLLSSVIGPFEKASLSLSLPFLFAYWVMVSFSYRGMVYRGALERGVFAVDSEEIKKGWREECEEREEPKTRRRHDGVGYEPAPDVSVCPDCGNEMEREATFCNLCGAELKDRETEDTHGSGEKLRCPDCGREIFRKDSYCWRCGAEV